MRIIRGKYKTRRFSAPKGFLSRPTTDFAKEGLFNMLENKVDLEDLNILDLCSGSGNITFEFLSRESGHVTSVDSNFRAIKHQIELSKTLDEKNVIFSKSDIISFLKKCNAKFDIIFADPPYDFKDYKELHRIVFSKDLLTEDGMLIIEHGKRTNLEELENFERARSFGNVHFSFFEKQS